MSIISSGRKAATRTGGVASKMAGGGMKSSFNRGRKIGRPAMYGAAGVVGASSGAYLYHRHKTQAGLASNSRGIYGY